MSHHIEKLSVENFKSCKELNINLTNFVPLVGYNNAGKSNILSAIEWLLKPKILGKSDFNDVEKPVTVSGQITGITPQLLETLEEGHRKAIAPFITDGNLTIKRNQPINASKATDIELFVQHPANGFKKNPTGISNAIKNLFPEPIRIAAMDNAADDSSKSKSTSTIGNFSRNFAIR
ncbi:AAA family ATPase [uncultured Pseudomonas sp.]|uniref:AAA family ATPase n=1 Tax=uncultured Pseudomonas sp. TaxID=114707 RepID=UPI0025E521E6|nr:AAA family ATPase [uncultured Pseudomonas sp.]